MAYSKIIHKYKIELTSSNENISLDLSQNNSVKEINMLYNYFKSSYPIIVLNLALTEPELNSIRDNNLTFFLRIYRLIDSAEETENGISDTITDKIIFESYLKPFDNPVITKYTKKDEDSETSEENEINQKFDYQVSTIMSEPLLYNDEIINEVFENATVTESVVSVLSKIYNEDFFMQESTNNKKYNNIIIPPMNLVPAIKYIHDYYSIYDYNLNIFFDNHKLFIFDILKSNQGENENSLTIEVKPKNDASENIEYGAPLIDEKDNVLIYMSNEPIYGSTKDVGENILGGSVVYNSYDDNYNLVTRTYNENESGKVRYYWNTSRNYMQELANNKILTRTASINLLNCDPSLFSPSTFIKINSTLNYMYGEYTLLMKNIKFYFFQSSFVSSTTLSLAKI